MPEITVELKVLLSNYRFAIVWWIVVMQC